MDFVIVLTGVFLALLHTAHPRRTWMDFMGMELWLTLYKVAMEVDGEAATTKQPTASAMRRLAAKARPRKRVSKSQKSIVFQKKQHKGKGDSIGRVGKR